MIFKKDISDELLKPILHKINFFIKYSAGILIGCSVIGLGKILPQDSIKLGCPGLEPGTSQLKAEYSTIELATPLFNILQLNY